MRAGAQTRTCVYLHFFSRLDLIGSPDSLTITNSRATSVNNIIVSLVPATGSTIEQSWNLNAVSTNTYTLPYVLASKQLYTGSGYISGGFAATIALACDD